MCLKPFVSYYKWVSKIQEYDLEIKPTKLIKGKGNAKMMTQGNEEELGIIFQNSDPKPLEEI